MPHLNNEDDDGVLRVILAWVGTLENAALLCSSNRGGCCSSGFRGHSLSDCCEYSARHAGKL